MRPILILAGVWVAAAIIVGTATGQWLRRRAADFIDPNDRA